MAHQITIEQCAGEHKVCIASAADNAHIKHLYVCTTVTDTSYGNTIVSFEVNISGTKTRYNYLQDAVNKYNSIP